MLMTESDPLWWGDSPYKHNRFPLTPLWCYRRARDGMPYGMIRDVRDAQEDYNKRASKALFILSTNRVIMDKGAIDAKDIERFRAEVARPDAIIEKNGQQGAEDRAGQPARRRAPDAGRPRRADDPGHRRRDRREHGPQHERAQRHRDRAPAGPGLGRHGDDLRQLPHGLPAAGREDPVADGAVLHGQEGVRIVGDNQPIEWLPINAVDESGQPVNDITASEADFIVSEQDFRASLRQAQAETLMEMLGKLAPVMPQAAMNLLDLVVDLWDIPNKDEWVKRIREINGQTDPAKKPRRPKQLAMAKAQAMAQEQAQLVMDKLQAEVDKAQGARAASTRHDARSSRCCTRPCRPRRSWRRCRTSRRPRT
jgi:hypothetical protein